MRPDFTIVSPDGMVHDTVSRRSAAMTNEAVLHVYLQSLAAASMSPRTIENKRYSLGSLAKGLDPVPLLSATYPHLLAWQARVAPTISRGHAASLISHVRVFYAWCVKPMHLIAHSPAEDLRLPRVPKRKPRPVPPQHLEIAIACAVDPMLLAWLYLGAYAGLRCCEIAALTRQGVLNGPVPRLEFIGKGAKPRSVHVGQEIMDLLAPFLGTKGFLFTKPDGRPITPRYVSNRIVAHFRGLNLPYTAHQLRHFYGTRALELTNGDLRVVQEQMGHESPETTALYTMVNERQARELAQSLNAEVRGLRGGR